MLTIQHNYDIKGSSVLKTMRLYLKKDFYTVQEVSKLLTLSAITIYKYIKSSHLEAIQFGGHYRIPRFSLEKFIDGHKVDNS